jgi:2-keto-4-pentenoate hydratase/2-oxohepta-3-ene-1,7-dioic acid hydratase in catechol pathway
MTVWCAIRTYAAHASELGNEIPKKPAFFLKADACLTESRVLNTCGGDVHHEVELVVRIGDDLLPDAMTVGLDLTKRSHQDRAKSKGMPWAEAKSFVDSAVIGEWVEPIADSISLEIDGRIVQSGKLDSMVCSIVELIAELSEWAPLMPGDILFTGTPPGVGPLRPGMLLKASLFAGKERLTGFSCNCV